MAALPLETMSFMEKYEAFQQLWEDLVREDEESLVPAWHAEALREREAAVRAGDPDLSMDEAREALWKQMGWK